MNTGVPALLASACVCVRASASKARLADFGSSAQEILRCTYISSSYKLLSIDIVLQTHRVKPPRFAKFKMFGNVGNNCTNILMFLAVSAN